MSEHSPAGSETTTAQTGAGPLPSPEYVVTALPYIVGFEAMGNDFLLLFSATDMALISFSELGAGSPFIHAVAPAIQALFNNVDPSSAYLVAHTPPQTATAVYEFTRRTYPNVLAVLHVRGNHWRNLSDPDHGGPAVVPTDREAIDTAMIAVAVSSTDRFAWLRPGPPSTLTEVSDHLQQMTTPGPNAATRNELRANLARQRRARASGYHDLTPTSAAQALLALADEEIWQSYLFWDDEVAQQFWEDLSMFAPPQWVTSVGTLLATSAFQRGDYWTAWLAALHADRATASTSSRFIHNRYLVADLPERIRDLLRIRLRGEAFRGFLIGALWVSMAFDDPSEVED
jgi:hypothetical protein